MASFESIPPAANLSVARPAPPTLTGMADGLPRMIAEVARQVRTLAAAVPAAAEEISQIDELLKAVLIKAIPGGGGSAALNGGRSNMLSQPVDAPI